VEWLKVEALSSKPSAAKKKKKKNFQHKALVVAEEGELLPTSVRP
jgi:hypothetical protein